MTKQHAFSLVELSIVLVILGLLVGGVLTGQSLIRAAELRSVTTELQQYQTAVQTFRDRFFAIPGDMRNATDFWDEVAAGAACATTVGTGTQTCNGNGDGRIGVYLEASEYENFRFWQHLANAGLIEGTYTGVAGSASSRHAVIGENVPRARLSGAGFSVGHHPAFTTHVDRNLAESNNSQMTFGGQATDFEVNGVVLIPEEAWNIDIKVDDGLPATGRIVTYRGAGTFRPNCANATDTDYNLVGTAVTCVLNFVGIF